MPILERRENVERKKEDGIWVREERITVYNTGLLMNFEPLFGRIQDKFLSSSLSFLKSYAYLNCTIIPDLYGEFTPCV